MDNNFTLLNYAAIEVAIDKGDPVFIVKDEADLEAASAEGVAATTCIGGYIHWVREHSKLLEKAKVYVFFTKDVETRRKVKEICMSLAGIASEVNACEVINYSPNIQELRDLLEDHKGRSIFNGLLDLSMRWNKYEQLVNIEEPNDSDKFNNFDDELGKKAGAASQAQRLYDLFKDQERFHDQFNKGYIVLNNENVPIRTKDMENRLLITYKEAYNELPSPESVKKALRMLEAEALVNGKEYPLELRIAKHGNDYYYDLCNTENEAVRFNSDTWEVIKNPPIVFRRQPSMQRKQVVPRPGKSLQLLQKYLNVKKDQFLLLLVWIVSAFIPDIPHPIPNLHGSQGSAKTTATKVLKRVIDPSPVEILIFARDINQLIQQLSHQYLCCYDNLNGFKEWVSDVFCRTVTGEGFTKRELYSDDSDVVYAFRRCLCLNGICIPAYKPDLLDRSILFELDRIKPELRREESQFWNEFEEDLPYILAAIFDVLVKAIGLYPTIQLNELYRMADFTKWGAAIAESIIPGGKDLFIDQYKKNIDNQNEEALNADIISMCLMEYLNKNNSFDGSTSSLFAELAKIAETKGVDIKSKAWPQDVRVFGKKLKEIKTNIAYYGFDLVTKRDRTSSNVIIKSSSAPKKQVEQMLEENDATNTTIAPPPVPPEF
ncbi:MAG: hypothetical protein BWY74_02187 [Firmicutes bacterium ADurb.Bin419]|nr:MAG: hypothetical protein BWY74_02187 [Firmicutes bacterium ADurb.Bin419]